MSSDNSIAVVYEVLAARLRTGLPTGVTLEKVKFPNAKFTTPSDKWLRVTMQTTAIEDLDASGACELIVGRWIVDVFYAKETGIKAALATAQEIKNRYNGYSADDVVITRVELVPRGEDGNWFAVQLVVNYEYQSYDSTLLGA